MKNNGNALRSMKLILLSLCFFVLFSQTNCQGQDESDEKEKTLYVISTSHLDTQWRWTIQKSIDEYLKATLDDNFKLLEDFPEYNFNFEGAFRYMMMKEYYPARYARMSDYIARGRWNVAGSTIENGDMNLVSPESLIRQTLLGNNFFEDEFGTRSTDIYLPDCFGFSYTMPTWMTHCGLNGFSTAKLAWGSSVGIPFDIGVWKGPDGSSIVAALNPGSYSSKLEDDLSVSKKWIDRVESLGKKSGAYAAYKYFGTGDTGGAPGRESCEWLEKSVKADGDIKVISAGTDDLYSDVTEEQKAKMQVYDSEMLMTKHGAGCYTAQAIMKRWNRHNELLADAAERAAAFADCLGAVKYPLETLNEAWVRFLWHTHHDDLTGTSIPEAYHFSWNDEILSMNQFASILTNSIGAVAQMLDTEVKGQPVVVYNPLSYERNDTVEATISYDTEAPEYVRVFDGAKEVPGQVVARDGKTITVAFVGTVPSVGVKVFDVRSSTKPCALPTGVTASENVLENSYYKVTLDNEGNIASIFDKVNDKEVLAEPCRLELRSDYSTEWPAWEIQYKDVESEAYAYVKDDVKIELVENGPARAAYEITRKCEGSTYIQKVSLAASGYDAHQVMVENLLDWRTKKTLLKAVFPFTVGSDHATYDLGMGTIQRKNNTDKLYEVPAQQWVDITAADGEYGVSVLSDSKYGWDKPSDNSLRLSLIHAPGVEKRYLHGSTQDLGQHKFAFAIAPHTGDWNKAYIPQMAAGMNQPLVAFQSAKHSGENGSEMSMVQVSSSQAFVKAVKKAERSEEVIVRVQELYGKKAENVALSVMGEITSAVIVNGCEQYIEDAKIVDGKVVFSLNPYQPMTFAITVSNIEPKAVLAESKPVSLPYNMDAFSFDSNRADGDFYKDITFPAEQMTGKVIADGVSFNIGKVTDGALNAVACKGQKIDLGKSGYKSLYILASAKGGDRTGVFKVGGKETVISVQDYNEKVVDRGTSNEVPYLKRDQVAWIGTHSHNPDGNMSYEFCNMYLYKIALPENGEVLTLPDNKNIVIFAVSMVNSPADAIVPAVELYDSLPYIPELASKPELRKNLALNKPVWADGTVNDEIPAMAVDGTIDNDSKWCSNSDGAHWLVVDLQEEYLVDKFIIKHSGVIKEMLEHGQRNSKNNTKDFKIQTSDDGKNNWKDLVTVEDNTEDITVHSISPEKLRYVRLYITEPTREKGKAARIFEFEIYGQSAEVAQK